MRLLALDLGTTIGWATSEHVAGARRINSGNQEFKPSRYEGGGMRYLKFTKWLTDMHLLTGGFGWVAFEEVRNHKGVDAAHVYGGFLSHLGSWCESMGVPYQGVPVGEIKKLWTGKGNAKKDVMIAEAQRRGFSPIDDNEADALAILHWMFDNEAPRPSGQRPASHSQPRARVQVGPVSVARPRVRIRGR